MLIAAVAVDDENLFATVAGHFIGSFLEQLQFEWGAVCDGSRFVLRFKDLAEVVLGKYHRVFLLGSVYGCIANVEQIRTKRQMRPVLLENAKRKNTGALRFLNGSAEIVGGELLPLHRQLILRLEHRRRDQTATQYDKPSTHRGISFLTRRILAPGAGIC